MHPSQRIYCSKSEKLKGKRIVLGITGSIAAVEDVKLIRELIRHGAEVFPVMSKEGARIVHPNSIQFAAGKEPIIEIDGSVPYVDLCGEGGRGDLLLIAPSTANTISKVACGIDDTPVTTFATNALGSGIPIVIAPAMHESMYENPTIRDNITRLKKLGVEFVEPQMSEEKAKMAGTDEIVGAVIRRLGPGDLKGKRVVVIAGSTEEPIDDVRVISNRSSGETGVELAKAAHDRGAEIELWMGRHVVQVPPYIPVKYYRTLDELKRLAGNLKCHYCLVPAAISDFTVKKAKGKIPSRGGTLDLRLIPAPKILKTVRTKTKGTVVGFKAEYGVSGKELEDRASGVLKEYRLDFIVANDMRDVGRGRTKAMLIDKKGRGKRLEGTKADVSTGIWSAILHGLEG